MGKPRRAARTGAAAMAALVLVAPCAVAIKHRDGWVPRDQRPHLSIGHKHDKSPPSPVYSEVGLEVPEKPQPTWDLIPSPYSEEMQKLASRGDMHAMQAIEKWPDWQQWKERYRQSHPYESVAAEVHAFRAFIENDMVISTHNADHASSYYSLGHSEWSAHSFHEFENLMFPVKANDIMPPSYPSAGEHKWRDDTGQPYKLPESVDWTKAGAVAPVMNQGECGSCWAFASTGAIEGICAIEGQTMRNGGPLQLSPQELVSCDVGTLDSPYADDGCDGGLPQNAFGYTRTTGGLCAVSDYPYVSGNGHSYPCTHCTKRLTVSGYRTVEPGNEEALMHAVSQQPVAVGIQANSMQLQLYRSGVFDSPSCGKEPDHAVLLVGYGTTSTNVPYWKLKNSWGPTWGDAGYFYIKRGVNQCGITSMPSYPTNCTTVNGGDPRGQPPEPLPQVTDCPAPRNGDIKLTSYPAGNLLIHFEGAWHPLCSQHLEIETAELMCQALGYTTAWSFSDRTIPTQEAGPMFPSLRCDPNALPKAAVRGADVLDMCSFKGAHTSDWLCELFGPSMAAYLVCHGTTPPASVLTCGTAGWPNRKASSRALEKADKSEQLRAVLAGTGFRSAAAETATEASVPHLEAQQAQRETPPQGTVVEQEPAAQAARLEGGARDTPRRLRGRGATAVAGVFVVAVVAAFAAAAATVMHRRWHSRDQLL